MPIQVEAPDGTIAEFPDGMSDDQIAAVMRKSYPPQRQAAAQPPRAAAPQAKPNSFLQNVTGAMANVNRGLGIGDEMAAGFKTVGGAIADGVAGREGPNIVDRFKGAMNDQRQIEDQFTAEHPHVAALSRGVGNAATVAVPGGPTVQYAQNASRVGNMARGAVAAGATAAGYALADRGSLQDRVKAASAAGWNPLTMGVGAAGGALVKTDPRAPRPVDPNVAMLAKEGVEMTPGQMRGGVAKVTEDAATSLPIVGPAIQEARSRGLDTYNRAAINRALEPIGETLPEGLNSGSAAIKYAGDKLSTAYKKVLPEIGVQADVELEKGLREISPIYETLTPQRQKQLKGIIDNRVIGRLKLDGEVLSGDMYKKVESELNTLIGRYSSATDGDQRAMGDALQIVKDALGDAAERQNPQFAAAKAQIDQGWAYIARAETAAASRGAEGGRFTAAQYDAAVRAGNTTVRKRGYARGDALGQDLSTAGKAVLPSKVPDSGTATRGAMGMVASIPGALVGAATGGGVGAVGGIAATGAGLTAASRFYTENAIAKANAALSDRISNQERGAALRELEALARQTPEAMEVYRQVMARFQRGVGVAGAAAQAPPQNALARGSQ